MEWHALVSNSYWQITKKVPDVKQKAILMFVYITTTSKEQDGAYKISLQFWKTGYLDVTKAKEKQWLQVWIIYYVF